MITKQKLILVIKRKLFGLDYGDTWQGLGDKFYERLYNKSTEHRELFLSYLQNKKISNVLEIGCGSGMIPRNHKELFNDYTGIDISKSAIKIARKNSEFKFIVGDFMKMDIQEKFDLVYSFGVIYHVPNVNDFIEKIIHQSNKFTYTITRHDKTINNNEHEMTYAKNEGIFNTQLSIEQIKKQLTILNVKHKIHFTKTGFVLETEKND